jgi:N-formylglutamate amidohydrolase
MRALLKYKNSEQTTLVGEKLKAKEFLWNIFAFFLPYHCQLQKKIMETTAA